MLKKLLFCLCAFFLYAHTKAQSVTVLDSTFSLYEYSATPVDDYYDYSYTQVIYRRSDIQAKGIITALKYYFAGTSLSNSDSVLVYLGNTSWDEFNYMINRELVPVARMDTVFLGKMSYTTLPGVVTINLTKPFIYNSDSNLVVAVNEKTPGNNAVVNGKWFLGYDGATTLMGCRSSFVDLNPMDPPYVESHLHNGQYLGGDAGVAKITLVGLSPNLCKSPRHVHFSNISHDNIKVIWSPPLTTSPSFYDIYYSLDLNKPSKATVPIVTINASDTQTVITNLLADTIYHIWLRSRCGGADTSVWTYMDSFHTICAPLPIPTVLEPFPVPSVSFDWLPHCWAVAFGKLSANSQLQYVEDPLASLQPWESGTWRNVSGSTNYAAKTYFVGAIVDSNVAWLISPSYDLGTSGNKSLEFDLALTKNGNQQQGTLDADDKFAVVISTDDGATWSNTKVLQQWLSPQTISSAGQHVSIPLNSYSGIVRIAFYVQSKVFTSPATSLFVDNVQITGVMPVTLLDFTGQKQDNRNLLQWRTATEQNNRGFELQRSANGIDFSSIAFEPTKAGSGGNSTALLSYSYSDTKPFIGNNYYRLKQIDFDGKATLSNVVLIKGSKSNELMLSAIYPNPASKTLHVVINAPASQTAQLLITDLAGRSVQQQTINLQPGDNNLDVNVSTLAKGVYILKVVCADGCEAAVSKFVKE